MSTLENLGVDVTSITLYVVNFGIIVFFVGKYLTGPLIEILEKRKLNIENNLNAAEKLREEMIKQKNQISEDKAKAEKKLQEQEENLRKQINQQAAILIKSAEAKSAELINSANETTERMKKEILNEAEGEIKATVKKMVTYIVSNKLPQEVILESVNEAWQKSFQNKK